MKVVCAPDSFKETLSAPDAARAMAAGVIRAAPSIECDLCPLGDGGEGTLNAIAPSLNAELLTSRVHGPLGDQITATFGVCKNNRLGIVELAQASGLALVPKNQRDPTQTTTFGTGELIKRTIEAGCDEVIVCVGGSATVEGGAGIAQALGVRFLDDRGREIETPITGGLLSKVKRVDVAGVKVPKRLRVACDVSNPLCGPNGAALVYGAQKGATPQQQIELDAALRRFADVCMNVSPHADPDTPGTGAAGGAAFGLMALCGATLERGIDLVLEAVGFEQRCRNASLLLTGEGRLDAQSLQGKACLGAAASAARMNVPTIAIVGSTGQGAEDCTNADKGGALLRYICLADRFGLERAMRDPAELIEQVAFEVAQEFVMPR